MKKWETDKKRKWLFFVQILCLILNIPKWVTVVVHSFDWAKKVLCEGVVVKKIKNIPWDRSLSQTFMFAKPMVDRSHFNFNVNLVCRPRQHYSVEDTVNFSSDLPWKINSPVTRQTLRRKKINLQSIILSIIFWL